jgi:protein phosphatase
MNKLSCRAAGLTDCGCVRSENQDNFFISDDSGLLVVADGMGGTEGGAVASQMTVDTIRQCWDKQLAKDGNEAAIHDWLKESIGKANSLVREAAKRSDLNSKMGTTIVAAVHAGNQVYIGHVGDSRAYLIRNGEAKLLTTDHSVVMEMYVRGQLTYKQCRDSVWKNLITRCVGHDEEIMVDCVSISVLPDDVILLATDGLSGTIEDDEIAKIIGSDHDTVLICKDLVARTLELGAQDNVTVVAKSF